MALEKTDIDQIQGMIAEAVIAGQKAAAKYAPPVAPASRAEVGSPEFAEDRTQVNSLNNKWMFEAAMDRFWSRSTRSDDHYADLQSRSLKSLDGLLELGSKVTQKFMESVDLNQRARMGFDYTTAYDLSNPNTLGTSDNVRGGVVPQNRAIDTATSQSTLNNTTMQTAIEAAVANALNGTVPTLEAAVGAAVAAALANTPVKTA